MKTRKGEPVIVVPEWQQQIVELERQLAERCRMSDELQRRLEQAEKERDDWQTEALANRGAEEAADELRDQAVQNANTALREKHALMAVLLLLPGWDKEATVEQNWRRIIERAEQVETERDNLRDTCIAYEAKIDGLAAERDELQRKLDVCQCETRVLNESLLIEAKREHDQLRAELATMREALELVKPARQDTYGWQRTDGHIDNCGCDWCVVNRALAATPHAAKAAERVRAMEMSLRAAHHELTTLHGLWACDNFDAYDKALADGCDHNAAWGRFCDEMWQLDTTKPIEQIDGALASTPHAAKAAEQVRKLENAVQAGRDYRDWVEVGCPDVGHDVLTPEQHFEFALDVLDALDKPEVQG